MKWLILFCAFSVSAQVARMPLPIVSSKRPAAAGGATVITTDTFNRTDANPLDSPASDGVSTWTVNPGGLGVMKLLSNEAVSSSGTGVAIINSPAYAENHYAEIVIGSVVAGGGATVRMESSSGDGYLIYISNTTTLEYYEISSTTYSQLGADVTVTTLVAGDRIKFTAIGSNLEVFVNDVSVATRSDSSYGGGAPGIFSGTGGGTINTFTAGTP